MDTQKIKIGIKKLNALVLDQQEQGRGARNQYRQAGHGQQSIESYPGPVGEGGGITSAMTSLQRVVHHHRKAGPWGHGPEQADTEQR